MSQKALYEIQYKLLGEPHADLIADLNVPVIDVVQELARKHNVAVNDDNAVDETGVPLVVPITDVHIHSIAADDATEASR